ncbi:MAG: NADP-dependent phosphogluconate dehydrogenase [Pyrinomonadaceae bacterium]|nr:NADP-dependent phosphogluconate dehydrogenase [Blastocatellia bacterium]MCW5957689.1 NADP-dependent phosphogluconate dehydrogenase [Pyrinomonadaceae bacterium]
MGNAQFGMIGLGTMGRNFLLNVAEHGFSCVGYDLDAAKRGLLLEEGKNYSISAADDLTAFIGSLETPRKIMLLVPAGPIVDSVINDLVPHLEKGDLIIDGGNSHYSDTERREALLAGNEIEFLGVGVSGGEEGARHGASIMVGGKPEVYEHVRPMLEAASAKVNGQPCAAHVGNSSAGHFVKMVHNGIEYGLMQLIAETYDLLHSGFQIRDMKAAELFERWNRGELNSFLIEITATVLMKRAEDGRSLVSKILDTAGQKGTGKWTSETAMEFGVPIPTIDAAVSMRQISARKSERVEAAEILGVTQDVQIDETLGPDTVHFVESGLHLAFIITYAQGFSLLQAASKEKGYELDMAEITKIWRGGCIIRSAMLEDFRTAFEAKKDLMNLLVADNLITTIRNEQNILKATLKFAIAADVPCMAFASALNYLKAYASERLPANLIQAQRDFFGAHTYQRIDKEGTFHTEDWKA